MKQNPTTRATPDRQAPARERDNAPKRGERNERGWRIGATQMAAPSTRRWRRAGRFEEA
jgi:hypothetical protein